MPEGHYDMIVVGSGPGGASLAHRLTWCSPIQAAELYCGMIQAGTY
jgi:hypothetical protein